MVELVEILIKAAAVFGLLALTVRLLRRIDRGASRTRGTSAPVGGRRGGRRRGRARRDERAMEVVERAAIGRAASLVLLRVEDQHFVVGVTEQQVSLLLEVDLDGGSDAHDALDLRAAPAGATGGAVPLAALLTPHLAGVGAGLRHRLGRGARSRGEVLELELGEGEGTR